jgi:mono/diheme cytochrome c family protein/Flp pilus assembly protein TadD
VAVVALALVARTSYSLWAKQVAANRLQIGAISDALRYLRRAARCTPDDGAIDMMLAFCFRQFRQADRWEDALQAAEEKGISRSQIEQETQLYLIQTGNWHEGAESQLAMLAGKGVTAYDVPAAFVSGFLASGRNTLAQQLLDAWNADFPNDAHVAYMRGKYWQSLGDTRQAQAQYEAAISLQSRHELARVALAEMFEEDDQLQQAFEQYAAVASVSPASEVAALGAAKVLRKMGRLDRAQAILEPLARSTEPPTEVAAGMGRIAMDRGDLPGAERWFERAGVAQARDPLLLMSAIRLLGIQGKSSEAELLFQRVAAVGDPITRARDLRVRLTLDPGDAAAAGELNRLMQQLRNEMSSPENSPAKSSTQDERSSPGRRLFALHCGACHGPEGDGNGLAEPHLFPPPRDIRSEPSRLVSTKNGVPTLEDTVAVLRRGIPGTSMPSYDDLTDDELRLLAEEVHRLRREGLHERLVSVLELQGEEVFEDDVRESVDLLTSPGEAIVVPPIGPAVPASLARGKEIYIEQGCASCHGEDGAGVADQIWCDERGFPVRARDLARELFKGGQDAASVYLRIAAGMPGTPHPASSGLPQQPLIDMVQFCLSLSLKPKKVLTDHQRASLATGRAYLVSLDME